MSCSRTVPPFVRTLVATVVALLTALPAAAYAVPMPTLAPSALPASSEPGARDALDRQTPRRTIGGFLRQGKAGDFDLAAAYLDLRDVPDHLREKVGPELAQKLVYALLHRRSLNLARVPDEPAGDPASKPAGTFVVDTVFAGDEAVNIALDHVPFPDGVERWLIARSTVAAIPTLDAAYGPRPVGVPIPASLTRPAIFGNEPWQWIGAALGLLASLTLALAITAIGVGIGSYFARRTPTRADDALLTSARAPLRVVIAALIFRSFIVPLQLTTSVAEVFKHATFTTLVVGIAWLTSRALSVATLWLDERAQRDGADLVAGRRMRTQATLLHRVALVTVSLVAGAAMLMQFEFVRSVGLSLLASAGVVSVVVGLAAQKSLAAIIGGIQFSVAQPVRIGDEVVVEGEFGVVEEIYLTYAVVRIWDKRRLVLPITYFLEKPFQNWTRSASDLLGTVLVKVDYAIPVEKVRAELRRICEADPAWDRQSASICVVDSDATSITLRAVVSAGDSSRLWDLRCNVRERLITFIQSLDGGQYVAKSRIAAEVDVTEKARG